MTDPGRVIASIARAAVLAAAAPLSAPAAPAGAGLELFTASREPVSREHVLDARIEAVFRSTISAQTSGRVEEVFFDVDDFVRRGELVIRLRDTEQKARVKGAEAALEEAQARLKEARSEFERVSELRERELVAKAAMDKATADLESAEARLESAEAALREAREQLGYTRVKAPYSGIVTERLVEVGESVNVGTPLMSGVSLERLRAVVQVPQRLIMPIREIAAASVVLDDGSRVDAESLTFFPYADPATNSFTVRVALPEGLRGLFPGMFVKVAFVTGVEERLVVPAGAVAYRSEVTGVYVVDGEGRVALRQVRTGRRVGEGMIEILAGLEAGERIALDPVQATAVLKSQQAAAGGGPG